MLGRTIYYDIASGEVLVVTSEYNGNVIKPNVDQDIASHKVLNDRTRNSFDFIELEYGQYAQDFAECNGYCVNPKTKTLEFSYPDPNEPEVEQPYQGPLSEQIASNMDYSLDVDFRLIMIELGMN